ncbi:MAG: hypothetical protein GXO92_05855 [FCB group bacterium]|nr:hypothetical protein [FCB group bacterium]
MRLFLGYFVVSVSLFLWWGCAAVFPVKEPGLTPVDPVKKYPPAELQSDFDYLFETLESVHPNLYAYVSRAKMDEARERTKKGLTDSLSVIDFWKTVTPVVARLGDGHTSLWFPYRYWEAFLENGGLRFPFNVRIEDRRLFITGNYSADTTIAVGDEILTINGQPAGAIIDRMQRCVSGERTGFKNVVLRKNFGPFLWALYDMGPEFEIEFNSRLKGERLSATVTGISLEEFNRLRGNDNPQAKVFYSYTSFPDEKIGIIDFRLLADRKQFESFLDTTFSRIREDSIRYLIIDIRKNGGGDSRLGDALFDYITDQPYTQVLRMDIKTSKILKSFLRKRYVKWYFYPLLPLAYLHPQGKAILFSRNGTVTSFEGFLHEPGENPLRFSGETFLLIGPNTFSSANMFAIAFKCYDMGVVIGEESGGLTVAYGDAVSFSLPNTGLRGGVSYKKFVHPCGKEDGHGVIPDYEVKQDVQDTIDGVDTVMEFTKELIRSGEY